MQIFVHMAQLFSILSFLYLIVSYRYLGFTATFLPILFITLVILKMYGLEVLRLILLLMRSLHSFITFIWMDAYLVSYSNLVCSEFSQASSLKRLFENGTKIFSFGTF